MGTLQVRIDDKLKEEAKAVFENLGFDLSTAIRSFLIQSVKVGGFPYEPREPDLNGLKTFLHINGCKV